MLRLSRLIAPAVRPLAAQRGQPRRSFVSPVLLTRTWENETVVTLRKEAKERGLSTRGSKATLVLRITEHDATYTLKAAPAPPSMNTRSAFSSTPAHPSSTVAQGPGIPPVAAASASLPPHNVFNFVIPDLSQPDPEPPVDVPYVPDFWNSKPPLDEPETVIETLPKLVIIGGVSTHGNGPTYNLETVSESEPVMASTTPETSKPPEKALGKGGLLDDISEDLGVPPIKEIKQSFWKLFS